MRSFVLLSILILSGVYCAEISLLPSVQGQLNKIEFSKILDIFRYQLGEITEHEITKLQAYVDLLPESSFLNPRQKIVVYLIQQQTKVEGLNFNQIQNFELYRTYKTILKEAAQIVVGEFKLSQSKKISIVNLLNTTKAEVEKIIKGIEHSNTFSVVISGTYTQLVDFVRTLEYKQKRLLQAATDTGYLIKFFFAVLFTIVTFAILISIADMNNQKDTLLYAKFIADVGGR